MWREYFEELLNNRNLMELRESFRSDSQENEPNETEESHPSRDYINDILKKIKNNKAQEAII